MVDKLTATAKGMSLPISRKQAVEVCRFINRRDIETARKRLKRVLEFKMAVPSTKFKRDIPHRAGSVGPGRFPIKAAEMILGVLDSAVSNAENKGMKASSLVVTKASACKGPTAWRYGRQSRRHAKRTHVEIVVEEGEAKKKEVKPAVKAEKPQAEAKPEQKAKSSEQSEVARAERSAASNESEKGKLGAQATKADETKAVKEVQKAPFEGVK
ncbi:MAG: 50S ribosomal protein L22 [Nanoarchaeota archaeon]|nr:50S ribosomal protein L22 [Nanoarchaeota archaeon]